MREALRRNGALFILLLVFAWLVLSSAKSMAPTADEYSHNIASGLSHWVTGDFRMNPAQPPLPKILSAIPLLMMQAKLPLDHSSWAEGNTPVFAKQFFDVYNHNMDSFVFWARVPILFLSLAFALSIFYWANRIAGGVAAWTGVILYVFCPDIVAHSGLATGDLAVSYFFFLALMLFAEYLRRPGRAEASLTGVLTGLALLSKLTSVLLLPFFAVIAVFSGNFSKMFSRKTVLCAIVCFVTVWAGYFFEWKPLLEHTPDPAKKEAMYEKIGGPSLARFARDIPVPLSTFSTSVVSMAFTRARGTNAFLMGEWSRQGWWYYYFVAFTIKNTIPFLVLAFGALLFIPRLGMDRLTRAVLLCPIVLFFVLTLSDKAQAGIRYFLPIYPLFFILAGSFAAFLWRRKSLLLKFMIAGLLLWHAIEAVRINPHPLAYFNQLIGGPGQGYRYLRDSNLDWGQGLKDLGSYLRKNNIDEVVLMYPWPADPEQYQIRYRTFSSDEIQSPGHAVYAVSAHALERVVWAKTIKPTALIGYSMFVWDLR